MSSSGTQNLQGLKSKMPDELILELKSIEKFLPVHDKQLLTYLKLTGLRKGLLMNFNASLLKHGIRSVVR